MLNKKWLLIGFVGIAVVIAGYMWSINSSKEAFAHRYSNETYGISFKYPDGYVLTEGEHGNGERGHYAIVLVREEDSKPVENGEGPTAITLDIYQNNLDKLSLNQWLDTGVSNYKLAKGVFSSTTAAGVPAVSYEWSGLYEGMTTAFMHKENIIAVSVTYLTPQDENIVVYKNLLKSIELN